MTFLSSFILIFGSNKTVQLNTHLCLRWLGWVAISYHYGLTSCLQLGLLNIRLWIICYRDMPNIGFSKPKLTLPMPFIKVSRNNLIHGPISSCCSKISNIQKRFDRCIEQQGWPFQGISFHMVMFHRSASISVCLKTLYQYFLCQPV